jgi:hypothetical protein
MGRYLKPLAEFTKSKSEYPSGLDQQTGQWVHLIALPNEFSYDEALLLTRLSEDEWLAWVPDYGEVTLHLSEFYFAHDLN